MLKTYVIAEGICLMIQCTLVPITTCSDHTIGCRTLCLCLGDEALTLAVRKSVSFPSEHDITAKHQWKSYYSYVNGRMLLLVIFIVFMTKLLFTIVVREFYRIVFQPGHEGQRIRFLTKADKKRVNNVGEESLA